MAVTSPYKQYTRGKRQAMIETDFDLGMMYTNGAVDFRYVKLLVNYALHSDGRALVPRPGLRTSDLILPNIVLENDLEHPVYHQSDDIVIKAAKECTEINGNVYKQFILGKLKTGMETEDMLWVSTAGPSDVVLTNTEDADATYSINAALGNADIIGSPCRFLTVPVSKIHNLELEEDIKVSTVVGTFAFGNKFYFINPSTDKLCHTEFDSESEKYQIVDGGVRAIDPSEAVTYGYNMLSGEKAYSFVNHAIQGLLKFTGILPYSLQEVDKLLLTPKKNEDIFLRAYLNAQVGEKYKFVWEWRNVGDTEWSSIVDLKTSDVYEIVQQTGEGAIAFKNSAGKISSKLEVPFKAPSDSIMVRIQAYNVKDTTIVEKAMSMGFDFTVENYGETSNIKQETYNLCTATGMTFWKNRLVLWGVVKDPTILFMSDVNDPTYFPYPNNVGVYDEPIISVVPFLDSLLVFTSSKVFQVSLDTNGVSWKSVLIQSNLSIEPWDRHLIQVVRNMVFFKSGNYYFMIVPKAQSTTGELILAPISTPIVGFFNNFEKNVSDLLLDTFNYKGNFSLVDYYNFLDYEDVHNMYVFRFLNEESNKVSYLHLDLLYNTVKRSWRTYTFEAPHFLYPYKHDATQTGTLASTSLLNMVLSEGSQGTLISVKSATEEIYKTSKLVLSQKGYDFRNVSALKLNISAFGELDELVLTFTDFIWKDDNTVISEVGDFRLVSSVTDSEEGFILESISQQAIFNTGSVVTIYSVDNLEVPVWGPRDVQPIRGIIYSYAFDPILINVGAFIELEKQRYVLDQNRGDTYWSSATDLFKIVKVGSVFHFIFSKAYDVPPIVRVINVTNNPDVLNNKGRAIQLYTFDELNMQDLYIPQDVSLVYTTDFDNGYFGFDPTSIQDSLNNVLENVDSMFTFRNWQFIDTGYRDDSIFVNKRYRELQLQLNNLDGVNLSFGMEFRLDGQIRVSNYVYETEHVIDVNDPNYGLIYVQGSPYMNLPIEYIGTPNETVLGPGNDTWVLNQSLFPELSLWKVRAPISGKGASPRLRLVSRNVSKFELMSINWIYRIMYMR